MHRHLLSGHAHSGTNQAGEEVRLPLRIRNGNWAHLNRMGIKKVSADGDEAVAMLPHGWRIESASLTSENVVDDKGRTRIVVYLAGGSSSEPEEAYMELCCRFSVRTVNDGGEVELYVMDGSEVAYKCKGRTTARCDQFERLYQKGFNWLARRFPQWRNVCAYW